MITFRAVRRAALSAVAAGILLAGMTGSAKAQTTVGGGATQTRIFEDTPNHDAAGLQVGWDLLGHGGFVTGDTFVVEVARNSIEDLDERGFLRSGFDINGTFGDADVWHGAGVLPQDTKAINTKADLNRQIKHGTGYYEYRMNWTYTDGMGNVHPGNIITGTPRSYEL